MRDEPNEDRPEESDADSSRRRATSVKLAWVFGVLALVVYLVAIWKLRPI